MRSLKPSPWRWQLWVSAWSPLQKTEYRCERMRSKSGATELLAFGKRCWPDARPHPPEEDHLRSAPRVVDAAPTSGRTSCGEGEGKVSNEVNNDLKSSAAVLVLLLSLGPLAPHN